MQFYQFVDLPENPVVLRNAVVLIIVRLEKFINPNHDGILVDFPGPFRKKKNIWNNN